MVVYMLAQFLQEVVGFWQVFAVGSLAFVEIWNGVQPESVDAHAGPEIDDSEYFLLDEWIVIIQVRLVMKEPMPVILAGFRIPRPVGCFKVLEDNANVLVLIW